MKCVRILLSIIMTLAIGYNTNAESVCLKTIDISGGEAHSLVLMNNGTLWATGDNGSYQLGIGIEYDNVLILKQVFDSVEQGYLQDIIAMDAGWMHSLAIEDVTGYVYSWGANDDGELGIGPGTAYSSVPVKVLAGEQNPGDPNTFLANVTAVSAGRSGKHSLAVAGGHAYAWGRNINGQCGNGQDGNNIYTPVKVISDDPNLYLGDVATIIAVEAGVNQSLAVDDGGHVWTWGMDGYVNSTTPIKVVSDQPGEYLSSIIAVSSCEHSLVLDSFGYVYQWGENGNPPRQVPGGDMGTEFLQDVVAVGAGLDYSLAPDDQVGVKPGKDNDKKV